MAMTLTLQHHLSLKLVPRTSPPTPISASFRCPYQVPSTTPGRKKKKRPNMGMQGARLHNSSSVTKLSGALSEYLWTEPRQRVEEFSPEDRRASVESVLTFGTLLDGNRFKLEPSGFNTILHRLGELKKSQEVGLVKQQRKTVSIIMKKSCPKLKWRPALQSFCGLVRCSLNTSLRWQVLVSCASNTSSSTAQFVSDTEIERTSGFQKTSEQRWEFLDEMEVDQSERTGSEWTGLPMFVYISTKYSDHSPRIKVNQFYGRNYNVGEWFYYTIEENPRMIGDTGNICVQDLERVCEFIRQNHETLMWYWDKGEDDCIDFDAVLVRLKKV